MDRETIIRFGTDVIVGLAVGALVKSVGFRHGTLGAIIVAALAHEALDAPVATALNRSI